MASVGRANVQTPGRPPDKRVHARMSGSSCCPHIRVYILLAGLVLATVTSPGADSLTTRSPPLTTATSSLPPNPSLHPNHHMDTRRSSTSEKWPLFFTPREQTSHPIQSDASVDIPVSASAIIPQRSASSTNHNQEESKQDGGLQDAKQDGGRNAKRVNFDLMSLEKKKLIINSLEQMFLKNAGLTKRPKISEDHAVPEYMLDLYQAKLQSSRKDSPLHVRGDGLITANTVRSFLHTEVPTSTCRPPLCTRLQFDVSSVTPVETLAAAELRVFVDTSSLPQPARPSRQAAQDGAVAARAPLSPPTHKLQVYEIMRPAKHGDDDVISRMLDTKVLLASPNGTWVSFDLLPAVIRWRRGLNHGLEVRLVAKQPALATDQHVRLRRSASLTRQEWALQRPILVIFTNDELSASSSSSSSDQSRSSSLSQTKLHRRKRSSKKNDNKEKNKNKKRKNRKRRRKNRNRRKKKRRRKKKGNKDFCQRHALYVDFTDVGWTDWIVAPKGYRADYCSGQCMAPMPYFFKASNHAMLQARVYKVNPSAVPMVCCVPIKMVPITMLYRDENGSIVMKNYEDMGVTECGCK